MTTATQPWTMGKEAIIAGDDILGTAKQVLGLRIEARQPMQARLAKLCTFARKAGKLASLAGFQRRDRHCTSPATPRKREGVAERANASALATPSL
jgi:hypothetical protein